MCQAWTRSGEVLVVARDRHLTIYHRTDKNDEVQLLEPVAKVLLRFAATTVGVVEEESGGLLLVVGCVAGVMIYSASSDRKTEVSSLGSFMDTVAVAVVMFSLDKEYLAVGTIDGRVIILRRIGQQAFSALDSPETVIKVLAAPRVTSLTFSPTSDKLIATTRKGNVYVFTRESKQWALDTSFESLIANPKGGATSQTLSCWWGAQKIPSTPILTIAAKSSSCNLELYDVRSRSRLHTLQLGSQRPGADGFQESTDRHIMGIVSVPTSDAPRLVAIDSDAIVSIIAWPFLAYACPR
jgi:WD40 repeat protein